MNADVLEFSGVGVEGVLGMEAVAFGVQGDFIGLLLNPAGAVGDARLLPAQDALIPLHFWSSSCVDALERLSVHIGVVCNNIFTGGEGCGGLAVLAAVVLVLEDVFGFFALLCGLEGLYNLA
jgi:hypothetical protein